ncbi:hypothetical protein ACEXAJ_11495 [Fusobacterium necrophorum subsp. funduliforme]
MKCACCEREITKDERFYEFDDEFYCDSCVEEEYITLYRINGSESYYGDEVAYYENINGYINDINFQIKYYQARLKSEIQENSESDLIKYYEKRLQRLEQQKRRVLGEDEK